MSSRRKFIKNLSLLGLSAIRSNNKVNLISQIKNSYLKTSIAIVGGGLAGLRAAYLLSKDDKLEVKLFEGSNRLGGRVYTDRHSFSPCIVELGGEFIDSGHEDMHDLIKEFDLEESDTVKKNRQLSSYDVFINGRNRNMEYENELSKWSNSFESDKQKSKDLKYREKLNNYSLKEYLDSLKVTGWFRDYLRWIFTAEFGLEYSEINCLLLHKMIGYKDEKGKKHRLTLFEDVTDQRYKIKGGNDKLIIAIANQIKPCINLENKLISIRLNEGQYELIFENNKKEQADYIILALPLPILRNIRLEGIKFSDAKQRMIENTRYGTHSKVILGFNERIWRNPSNKSVGSMITNNLQSGWDSSILQNEDRGPGAYTFFMGGHEGISVSRNSDHIQRCLKALENIYPGTLRTYSDISKIFNWSENPFAKGSYICLRQGELFIYNFEEWQKPEGRIYFAGEHCSEKYQGYMNGAAESAKVTVANLKKDMHSRAD